MATKKKYRLPIYLRNKMGRGFERTFDNIRERYDNFVQKKLEISHDIFFAINDDKHIIDKVKCMTNFVKWQPCVDKHHPIVKQNDYKSEYDTFVYNTQIMHILYQLKTDSQLGCYYETRVFNACLLKCNTVLNEYVCVLLHKKLQRVLVDNKCEYWVYYDSNQKYQYSFEIQDIRVDTEGVKCSLLIKMSADYMKSVQQQIIDAGGDVEDCIIAKNEVYKMKRDMFDFLKAARRVITPLTRTYEKSYSKTWAFPQPEWNGQNAGKSFKDIK